MQQYADIYLLQGYSAWVPIRPHWREVAASVPVPEAAVTVFSTPDDGCCDTRNMQCSFAVNKYLHTVASGWIFINTVTGVTYVTTMNTPDNLISGRSIFFRPHTEVTYLLPISAPFIMSLHNIWQNNLQHTIKYTFRTWTFILQHKWHSNNDIGHIKRHGY